MKTRITAAILACLAVTASHAANRPPGYKTICSEGQSCYVEGLQMVAFGRSDRFFFRQHIGAFECKPEYFQGATLIPGGKHECSVPAMPGCLVTTGEVFVTSTLVVPAGKTFDGGCKRYTTEFTTTGYPQPGPARDMFRLEPGATLRNVVVSTNDALPVGSTGIRTLGSARLENVSVNAVSAHAQPIVVAGSGVVEMRGGSAGFNSTNFPLIQVEAAATVKVSDYTTTFARSLVSQPLRSPHKVSVVLDRITVESLREGIFRSGNAQSTAAMNSSMYCKVGYWGPWLNMAPANVSGGGNFLCGVKTGAAPIHPNAQYYTGEPPPNPGSSTSSGGFGCKNVTGEVILSSTVMVPEGQTFDGGCKRYKANGNFPYSGETDHPLFRMSAGATLQNVVIDNSAGGDGVHTHGNATLRKVSWEKVGDDALTVKTSGIVDIDNGYAEHGADKIFQVNAPSTLKISNFKGHNAAKFVRQNGGTTFRMDLVLDRVEVTYMREGIFRTDSSVSTVRMTNSNYCEIGQYGKWYNVNPANIYEANNTQCGPPLTPPQ